MLEATTSTRQTAPVGTASDAGRRAGRPRKLTEQMIVDAAIEIGLDHFTIAQLAERLGTGISAIYRVMQTRDRIIERASTFQASQFSPPADHGQPWWDYIEACCAYYFAILTENKVRAAHFLEGGVSARSQFESGEGNYRALMVRDFAPLEAFEVMQGAKMIVGGAALSFIHLQAAQENGADHARDARELLHAPSRAGDPAMAEIIAHFEQEAQHTDWRRHLRVYLRGVASARGEMLPY